MFIHCEMISTHHCKVYILNFCLLTARTPLITILSLCTVASLQDRTAHVRICELEAQLSQMRGEIARLKREKEESERKFNSRLYDLKDRLEQSHSTNRSMQNYVHFLKNSYANVFGDSSLTLSVPPVAPPPFH